MRPIRSIPVIAVSLLAFALLAPSAAAGPADTAKSTALTTFNNLWWSVGAACEPAKDTMRQVGATRDEPSSGDSSIEYDPLNRHECRKVRDDGERAAYDVTGADDAVNFWECSGFLTPWETCIGVNRTGCDLWVSTLWGQCVGGIFPDNTPS